MAQGSRNRKLMGDINVVPYIDVMLVLLIIFMVTAPLLMQGVKVDLPKAAAEPLDPDLLKNANPLVLSIDKAGKLYLNVGSHPESSLDEDTVGARTGAALRRNPDLPVLVKADRTIAYGQLIDAMVILQKSGAAKVGFITDPPPAPPHRG
jgi:biopolymer transport protein TolR